MCLLKLVCRTFIINTLNGTQNASVVRPVKAIDVNEGKRGEGEVSRSAQLQVNRETGI